MKATAVDTFVRPIDAQAARIADLGAQLQLKEQRIFYLSADVARLNAEINQLARYINDTSPKPSARL